MLRSLASAADTEILGIRSSKMGAAEIRLCYFHIMQAWQRYLRRSDNGVDHVSGHIQTVM